MDSLDATEIALNIEREFGMEITVEQMDLLLESVRFFLILSLA